MESRSPTARSLAPRARRDTIRFALDLGLTVVTEIGKKDPGKQPPIEVLAEQALADFDAGASWVTVEARESGRGVGVFDEDGTVVEEDVERLRPFWQAASIASCGNHR